MDDHRGGHDAQCDASFLNEGDDGANDLVPVTLTRSSAERDFKVAFGLVGGTELITRIHCRSDPGTVLCAEPG